VSLASINLVVSFKPRFYEKVIYFIVVPTVQAHWFNLSIKCSYTPSHTYACCSFCPGNRMALLRAARGPRPTGCCSPCSPFLHIPLPCLASKIKGGGGGSKTLATLLCYVTSLIHDQSSTNELLWRTKISALPDFLRRSGSGMGSAQPHEYNWGATWKKK
jgi:hypothetical protein